PWASALLFSACGRPHLLQPQRGAGDAQHEMVGCIQYALLAQKRGERRCGGRESKGLFAVGDDRGEYSVVQRVRCHHSRGPEESHAGEELLARLKEWYR